TVLHAIVGLLPDGLAEPDLESVDVEPPPATRQKVSPLMHQNHEVEHHHDEKEHTDEAKDGKKNVHKGGERPKARSGVEEEGHEKRSTRFQSGSREGWESDYTTAPPRKQNLVTLIFTECFPLASSPLQRQEVCDASSASASQ